MGDPSSLVLRFDRKHKNHHTCTFTPRLSRPPSTAQSASTPKPPEPFRRPTPNDERWTFAASVRSRSPQVYESHVRFPIQGASHRNRRNMILPQRLASPTSPRGQQLADGGGGGGGARELDVGRGREARRRRPSKLGRGRRDSGGLEPSRGLTRGVSAAMLKEGTSVPSPGLFERGPQTPDFQQVRVLDEPCRRSRVGLVFTPHRLSAISKGYTSLSGWQVRFSCGGAKSAGIRTPRV